MSPIRRLLRKYKKIRPNMIHVDESDPVGEVEAPFPYRDVAIKRGISAKDLYETTTEIGRGKFGTVYECREIATGLRLAAKFVGVSRREERRSVEREVDIMRKLRHPRLIQLYDAIDEGKVMCVVLELITGGELFERVIDDDFVLTEKSCTVFMRQICEGIDFVHQQNILHLDMKPENILCLTKTGNRIKIIDFGLARAYEPDKKLQVLFGTPEFVAPEVVNFDQIGFGTDMWSIGVICYVLLSGLSPFMGETDIETMANVTVAKYDFDDEAFNDISDDAKDFIRKLLVKDKQSRLTAGECLRHEWIMKRPEEAPPPKPKPADDVIKEAPRIHDEPYHASSSQDELDVTKDNLRQFVERWSEHPNSPYVFDISNHEITPCVMNGNADGQHSVGGCSPSPRSSLASSPDLVLETDDTKPSTNHRDSVDNHLLTPRYGLIAPGLERRASDSSCFVHKKADISVRVNLAEEIKKLSDHLFMLSTMNTDLMENNNRALELDKNKTECNTSTGSSRNIETKTLPNGFHQTTETSSRTTTMNNGDTKKSKTETRKVTVTRSNSQVNSKFFEQRESGCVTSNMPWAKNTSSVLGGRTKFRVTCMNRDVPIVSPKTRRESFFGTEFNRRKDSINNFVNGSHGNNGFSKHLCRQEDVDDMKTNAHNTKDLLLHLLDQWDESQGSGPKQVGRHKSMSIEWSEEDKLAQKSMRSVNTFFKRQTSNVDPSKKRAEPANVTTNGFE